ncbi:hypothetical protein L3X38_033332 [Prunus dulcis]|uniref:Uncharacterized protein n=1 Tax=Prunus dulcis TaxID=3755 RepID=A0AAD4VH57_PRUDU|nr:hypothetical protein L3X38_033332 [Prunus dulcis]
MMRELNDRFSEQMVELLTLSTTLDLRNSFMSFSIEHICKLAKKFYLGNFLPQEFKALEVELKYFQNDIKIAFHALEQLQRRAEPKAGRRKKNDVPVRSPRPG